MGVVQNKTYVMSNLEAKVDKDLQRHLLRGIYDGDGSIYYSRMSWHIGLTNYHASFLEDIQDMMQEHIDVPRMSVYDAKTSRRFTYNSDYAGRVCEFLYKDSEVYLDRKYALAEEVVDYMKLRL